jgi:RNA polymerase sigma factor (sigma-70 family)
MNGFSLTLDSTMTESQNERIKETVLKERSRLMQFIRRRIPDKEEAEDILQDVFGELTVAYRMMEPIEQVTRWLYTIARNRITDLYRKKKTGSLEDMMKKSPDDDADTLSLSDILPDESDSQEMKMFRAAIMEELEIALDELPKEQREVFILHEIEEISFKEIAAMTGVNEKTLLSRKHYAVMYLRKRLRDLYDELLNN